MARLTEWIYCRDRLPSPDHMEKFDDGSGAWTESKRCIVGVVNDDGSRQLGIGSYCRSDSGQEYWTGPSESGDDLYDLNVVAWIPFPALPDPPLKEDE